MTTSFQQIKAIEAKRDLDRDIHAHKNTYFDFASLDGQTRLMLRVGLSAMQGDGPRINLEASTVTGMTIDQVDRILECYFKERPAYHTRVSMGIACKIALQRAGILLPVQG